MSLGASRKGKSRAMPSSPRCITSREGRSILKASAEEFRPSIPGNPVLEPVAGPSARRDPLRPDPRFPPEPHEIYRLMNDERLLIPGAAKPPREIVVLCHGFSLYVCRVADASSGLYGFSTSTPFPLFPSLKLHYWASVLEVLRDRMGVKILVVGVKGYGKVFVKSHTYMR